MGETLVADTETNGLLADMTKLHMIQCGTLNGTDETIYADNLAWEEIERARNGVKLGDTLLRLTCPIRPLAEGLERIRAAEKVYFHNGIGYDRHVFDKFAPGTLRREQVVDTLVLARLLTQERSNSLEDWGKRLGCHKANYEGDFQRVDAELLAYSQKDIAAGRALAQHLIALSPGSERAIACEMAVAWWIDQQVHTGVSRGIGFSVLVFFT